MNYFDGIRFTMADSAEASDRVVDNFPFYYGVQYLHRGRLYLRVDSRHEYRLAAPAAFFTTPDYHYHYQNDGPAPREHYWVCFLGDRVRALVAGGLLPLAPAVLAFGVRDGEAARDKMTELIALVLDDRAHDRAVCALEQTLLLLHEQRLGVGPAPDARRDALAALRLRIDAHPEREWDFAAEAARLNISPNHFARLFRRHAAASPLHYLLGRRLQQAARRLVETDDPVARIARDAGFANAFYFSRLFTRRYGLSPRSYRRQRS